MTSRGPKSAGPALGRARWVLGGPVSIGLLLGGCDGTPIELRFVRSDPEGLTELDRLSDGGIAGRPPASGGSRVDASRAGSFSPGPECEDFPNACTLEGRTKCTLVSNDPGYRSSCVPLLGDLAIGESCARRVRGDDDCAQGGFCTPISRGFELENRMVCRRLCSASDQCEVGQRCLQLLSSEPRGLCVDECTVFEDDCGSDDLRCVAAAETSGSYFGYCEIFGGRGDGESCTLSSQCQDGFSCELASQTCRASCDAEHPCEQEDRRCIPLELVAGSLRLCVP